MIGGFPISRKRFLIIWSNHTLFIIILKIYGFILLNTLLQQFISTEQYPIYGGLSYLPVIALLLLVPRILKKKSVITALNICLYSCGILFLCLWVYLLFYPQNLPFVVLGLALFIFMGALESIYFDRFVSAYCALEDLPFAISWTRQANTLAYMISPLLGGILYGNISLYFLLGVGVGVLFLYRSALVSLPSLSALLLVHQQSSTMNMGGLLRNNKKILYLFSLNFFWLSIISIMLIPYLQVNFTVSQIGIILSSAGAGLFVGNSFSLFLLRKLEFIFFYHLCALLFVLSLCILVAINSLYVPSCILVFIGSVISSLAYVSAQFFLQKKLHPSNLVTFYSLRNLMNAIITIGMFFLLWLFLTSQVGIWLKLQFQLHEHQLFSFFFICLAALAGVGYCFLRRAGKASL